MSKSIKLLHKQYPQLGLRLTLDKSRLIFSSNKAPDDLINTDDIGIEIRGDMEVKIRSLNTPELRLSGLPRRITCFIGGNETNNDFVISRDINMYSIESQKSIEKMFFNCTLNKNVKTI